MEDKRRRARVQGGWAGPLRLAPQTVSAALGAHDPRECTGLTRWGREQPATPSHFQYWDPVKVERKVPEPRVIDAAGSFDISVSPAGVSRLRLFPKFIDPKEASWMFEQLHEDIPWRQRTNIRRDCGQEHSYREPRLTAWYGELPYTYSRNTMQPNPHWHPLLTMLKDRIEEVTGYTFNSLLCNLYRNDKDSIDWHSDDEASLGKNPIIASLSLGETRVFEMRRKPPPDELGDYTYVEQVRVPLDHGTLLLMEGATQNDWQHRVPKEYHSRDTRINLTFRTVYPEPAGMRI